MIYSVGIFLQSDYEGQMRTLLNYIDPKTDAVIVAGGDGALMEVWMIFTDI